MQNDIAPATDLPKGLVMLENFPGYGITRAGEVWRCFPLMRGRYAGRGAEALRPSIHPRGHQWYVHLRQRDGQRVRIALNRLAMMAFGVDFQPPARHL